MWIDNCFSQGKWFPHLPWKRGRKDIQKNWHFGWPIYSYLPLGPSVNPSIPHPTRPCLSFLLFSFLWRFLGGPLLPSLWPRAGGRAIYLEARTPAMLWTSSSHMISQASNKQGLDNAMEKFWESFESFQSYENTSGQQIRCTWWFNVDTEGVPLRLHIWPYTESNSRTS